MADKYDCGNDDDAQCRQPSLAQDSGSPRGENSAREETVNPHPCEEDGSLELGDANEGKGGNCDLEESRTATNVPAVLPPRAEENFDVCNETPSQIAKEDACFDATPAPTCDVPPLPLSVEKAIVVQSKECPTTSGSDDNADDLSSGGSGSETINTTSGSDVNESEDRFDDEGVILDQQKPRDIVPMQQRWYVSRVGVFVLAVVAGIMIFGAGVMVGVGVSTDASASVQGETLFEGPTTEIPSKVPSYVPSGRPSYQPSSSPSILPSHPPSSLPSSAPSSSLSQSPSVLPSAGPSNIPSAFPSSEPSVSPSTGPSSQSSQGPSENPSSSPTTIPTKFPSEIPTNEPSVSPIDPPAETTTTAAATVATSSTEGPQKNDTIVSTVAATTSSDSASGPESYLPGNLKHIQNGLLLSQGLSAKAIATSGRRVRYADNTRSDDKFHFNPDMGGTFAIPDGATENEGGWVYVSNSEMPEEGKGGVGALTFNEQGKVIKYEMILTNTTMNCSGGKTPWNTWVSCEENQKDGQVWEVDPFGAKQARMTVLGGTGGNFEAFAYDVRNRKKPRFFVTEDTANGALRRFTPSEPDWLDPSEMLHVEGSMEYLVLEPTPSDNRTGTYKWVKNINQGRVSARDHYQHTEGIDVHDNELFVISKSQREMFIFDLDGNSYAKKTTQRGLFDGQPDQVQRILNEDESSILYFTEEGGESAGVHGRDPDGRFFTILEAYDFRDETTGLDFSPDWKHLYVAYQKTGILFDITRDDGQSFRGLPLNVKFHSDTTGIK